VLCRLTDIRLTWSSLVVVKTRHISSFLLDPKYIAHTNAIDKQIARWHLDCECSICSCELWLILTEHHIRFCSSRPSIKCLTSWHCSVDVSSTQYLRFPYTTRHPSKSSRHWRFSARCSGTDQDRTANMSSPVIAATPVASPKALSPPKKQPYPFWLGGVCVRPWMVAEFNGLQAWRQRSQHRSHSTLNHA